MKRRIAISALALLLSVNVLALASCGGNKDTTHDAGGDGQVVTESKDNAGDKNNNTNDKITAIILFIKKHLTQIYVRC